MVRGCLVVSWSLCEIPAGLVETLCGDAGSRCLLACVLEGEGCMLCFGIKRIVHSVKLIDRSDCTL